MAYQPKYAQKKPQNSRKSSGNPRTPETLQRTSSDNSRRDVPQRQPVSPWLTALGIILVPICLALCYLLLRGLVLGPGQTGTVSATPVADMAICQQFGQYVQPELDRAEKSILTVQIPEETVAETTEATIPPYEAVYSLAEDTQVAPEPDQSKFGQVSDPKDMEPILKEAEYILDGQSLYFSTDTELFQGSVIRYYLDESIFAITWKEAHDQSVYTYSEVKIGHPSQLRRHLSDGAYASGKLYYPTEMAATVNAVVATSGDFYANRPVFGIVAYEGQVRRAVDDGYAETCYIDENGDMIFSYMKQLQNQENAQTFLDENKINFSLAFGPILVDNYEMVELPSVYGVGEIREEYARSALCQMDKLHYLAVVANWEGNQPDDPTVARFQKVVAQTGCKMAYCLDGGQTATIVMNDELINRPAKGEQRRISDIIYFATAVPEGG